MKQFVTLVHRLLVQRLLFITSIHVCMCVQIMTNQYGKKTIKFLFDMHTIKRTWSCMFNGNTTPTLCMVMFEVTTSHTKGWSYNTLLLDRLAMKLEPGNWL